MFELKSGATRRNQKYISRGIGYELLLTSGAAEFHFRPATELARGECPPANGAFAPQPQIHSAIADKLAVGQSTCCEPKFHMGPATCGTNSFGNIKLRLIGADPRAKLEGRNLLQSYGNYFLGADPRAWRKRVPQFGEIQYRNIYPGIDLVYHGNSGNLEYAFVVAPRADAHVIAFSIDGARDASAVRVGENGDLIVPVRTGEVVLHKPSVYQGQSRLSTDPREGSKRKRDRPLASGGRFVVDAKHGHTARVSFQLPDYDHSQTLVIDPTVSFSTFLGGSVDDVSNGMALDAAGNIYLIAQTNSPDYPLVSGAFQVQLAGQTDIVVTKMSGDGSHLIYSTYLGGSAAEYAQGIALDAAGEAYVTGETYSTDFPLVNPYQSHFGTGFVSKLSADGASLIYSTFLGGSLEGSTKAIVVDNSGQAIVAGRTLSTDFPVVNAFQPAHAADGGKDDGFLTKFSADGSSLVYSTYLGGSSSDEADGLAIDSSGSVYVVGLTFSPNFPTTPGAFQSTFAANAPTAGFVTKFSPSGQSLVYSTFLNGAQVSAVAVNSLGNAFLTGLAEQTGFPVTPGAFQTTQGGGSSTDAFVTELDSQGASLVYSTFLGGNNQDSGSAIVLDASNNAYITGSTASPNFPLQSPVQSEYGGVPNAFVAEFDSSGSQLLFSTYLGGGAQGFGDQKGAGLALDAAGNIYVVGSAATPDFPTVNALQPVLRGSQNLFVAKFLNQPTPGIVVNPASVPFSPVSIDASSPPQTITITNNGKATLIISAITSTGDFSETNNCSAPVIVNGQCRIEVTFSPTVATSETGQLKIASNASLVPVVVQLSGTGQDFAFQGTPGSVSVTAGQTATYSLSLSSLNGFNQQVSLTCSGAPSQSTCMVSPNSVNLNGTGSASVTVTTTAASDVSPNVYLRFDHNFPHITQVALLWTLLVFFRALFVNGNKEWSSRGRALSVMVGVVLIFSLSGCGGGSTSRVGGGGGGSGTPSGSYILTFTAKASNNLSHSLSATLQVN